MNAKFSPKSAFYAPRGAQSCAFTVCMFIAFMVMLQIGVSYALVTLGLSLALFLIGFIVGRLESRRIVPPFLRRMVCQLGSDGLLVGDQFYPWSEVLYAERDERTTGSGEGRETKRRVEIGLRNAEPIYVELLNPERFVQEFLVRSEEAPEAPDDDTDAYRIAPARPRQTLVRIAVDGSADVSERVDALSRLDGDERERLKKSMVDTRMASDL